MQPPITPAVGQPWSAPGTQNVPLVTPLVQAAPQSSATGAAGGTLAVRIFCTFFTLYLVHWNGRLHGMGILAWSPFKCLLWQ